MQLLMRRKLLIWALVALLGGGSAICLESCGSVRSYWGVEGNYDFDDYGYKHKKYKKYKKHKKHHRHHHDDDDD